MKKIITYFFILLFSNIFSQNKKNDDFEKLIDSSLVIKSNNLNRFYNKELKQKEKTENWNIYINNLKKINQQYICY